MKQALKILSDGGVIVFPTETLYALGAVATKNKAVKKVYSIKKRPQERLLPVIVGSMEQAKEYFILSGKNLALAKKFWPGPLSIILESRSQKLMKSLGSRFLAVRYPASTIASSLAISSGAPIVSTSANISGMPGCVSIAAIKKQFAAYPASPRPDLFMDAGLLKRSLPSTIVQIRKGQLVFIREGKIPKTKIIRFFNLQ
jgi:L-threonylcarbamoyladenylate synthase